MKYTKSDVDVVIANDSSELTALERMTCRKYPGETYLLVGVDATTAIALERTLSLLPLGTESRVREFADKLRTQIARIVS